MCSRVRTYNFVQSSMQIIMKDTNIIPEATIICKFTEVLAKLSIKSCDLPVTATAHRYIV
jgi:hypothetical protein